MNTVKIGVMDKEVRYVERLSAYLYHYGNCIWNVSAFTEDDVLDRYMEDKRIDLLISTSLEMVEYYQRLYPDRLYVFLANEDGKIKIRGQKIYVIYRYQSARIIGEYIKDIVDYKGLLSKTGKVSAIMYSPVGRCGKTMLAKQFINEALSDKWLYVGMEDYGDVAAEGNLGDDFIYYLKERRNKEIKEIIEASGGYISSPFSLFDVRRIEREDIEWFLELFEEISMYRGVLLDMGNVIINNYEIMLPVDHVIVPYLNNPVSLDKRKQFEELIEVYELHEIKERMDFIDMSNDTSPIEELRQILE